MRRVDDGLAPDGGLPQDVPLTVFDAQDPLVLGAGAERCERSVGADDLDGLDALRPDEDRRIRRERRGDAVVARFADDGLLAQRLAELDRGEVAREVEGLAHRDHPERRVVVVLRRPQCRVELDHRRVERRVVEHLGHGVAGPDGRGVNERLERRAGLPNGLGGAVVLRVVEVAPPDHGADIAGVRLDRHERALQVAGVVAVILPRRLGRLEVFAVGDAPGEFAVRVHAGFDGVELRLQRALGRLLHVQVERGVNAQAALVQVAPELRVQLHAQPFDEIRRHVAVVGAGPREHERVGAPQLALLGRERPLIAHQTQHDVAAAHGPVGVGARVVERGQLGERGEHRGFGDIQLLRVLAEIDLRRRLHAVRPRAQVDLVQVQLEDRVLGKVALDLDRDARFLKLTRERLLAADLLGEDVAGQLHRDGREPLRETERKHVGLDGAEDAPEVDPVVVVEALVLGGDERLAHGQRYFAERDHRAPLGPELADQPSVGRVDLGRLHLDVAAGARGIEARDAGAMLARAHPRPRAVGEAQTVGGDEHRDRDHAAAGLGIVPPGERSGQAGGCGCGDGRHRVTT